MTSSPPSFEPLYVVDTNALYWYLTGSKKLTSNANLIFEAAENGETTLVVSAIVLAELFWISQKTKILDFAQTYIDLKARAYFHLVDYRADEVIDLDKNAGLEMHDRMIVALARRLIAPLITSDEPIRDTGFVKVIW